MEFTRINPPNTEIAGLYIDPVTQKMVTCEISVPSYKQRHFAVNEKWLTTRFVFLHVNREIFAVNKNG